MTERISSNGSPARPPANHRVSPRRTSVTFPVVALGASAGGLDTFKKFLGAMPANCGMAFVLIQHLEPNHESMMVDLLTGHTLMKVQQASDGMRLERDHVYLIPPGTYLAIEDGFLRLMKPTASRGARMPFDHFLLSLADELGERAICAVLSGTGTDGSLGVKAVKEKGGLVVVQDPVEATFDGMPRSAISTGGVDLVLMVAEIPEALQRYGRQKYVKVSHKRLPSPDNIREAFVAIIDLLATQTSRDFSLYKQATLQRRIERRMAMAGVESSARYLQMLLENSAERDHLAKDLLINVTHFFRDPAAFDLLAEKVVPELVRRASPDRPLRIWVPGCSTGEEAYSIAMLFLEQIAAGNHDIRLQVFASDIDPDCVAFARNGIYPESIEAEVAPTRLARFFIKEEHTYRVVRELRDTIVFTSHNLQADPPFSLLDLISCRNLLIYFGSEAQRKVLSLFHFALRKGGVLFLGSSETVGNVADRFEPISKAHRIYRHTRRSRPGEVEFPRGTRDTVRLPTRGIAQEPTPRRPGFRELSQQTLLEAYAPASVLINDEREGLYYFGSADRYLKLVPGEDTRDVVAMARDGLRAKLLSAIRGASTGHAPITVSGAQMRRDGGSIGVAITVRPVESNGRGALFLVSFNDDPALMSGPVEPLGSATDASRIAQLEQELEATREDLQSSIHDLEITKEEHRAINEEAMSVSEEFQSTNEELETSKEELQALNEELTALNGQLHETVEQQRATFDDLQNILNSTDVATLFLDGDLNIRFFTPSAKSLFNVIASDVGRPLADLTHRLEDDDLLPDARAVLAGQAPIRREVKADDDSWFIRGVLRYQSADSRAEGVVITFSGISERKAAEREVEAARAYLDNIIATIRQPLVVLDERLRVISASSSFYRIFAIEPEELIGRRLLEATDHLDVPALREFLAPIKTGGTPIDDQEVEIELPGSGRRVFLMSARVLREEVPAKRKILVAIVDVTELKHESEALEAARSEAERANIAKSRFLSAASHDLRQPLQTISLIQGMLERRVHDQATLTLVHRLEETVSSMSGMLDKLLDINQLEAGIVRPAIVEFPIKHLLEEMRATFTYHAASNGLDWRVVPSSLMVRSDPVLLEQIIRNLLSNAVRYTTRGKLLVGCRRRADKLRIEVWDTGPGIPQSEHQAIFREFHQLDNPARKRSKGLGLGLAIVQRIAELLGHKIDVRSRLGAGSVFSVEVPIGRAKLADLPAPSRNEAQTSKPPRSTILIVEDDRAVRELLQLIFDDEGHHTLVAEDGLSALELVGQDSTGPDLVIADYNLPNALSGLGLIAALQEQLQRAIPAIVLTGDISTNNLREIARNGCLHQSKPVSVKELTRLAQRLLAKTSSTTPDSMQQLPLPLKGDESPTVFVVDDDRAVREAMRDLLQENGFLVETFVDGRAFFEALRPGGRGCLLVDARMPGMSGIELIERLKSEGHELPAIVITGHGAVPMAVQAMKAGALDFIEKPIRHKDLLAVVRRAISQTRNAAEQSASRETATLKVASLTARQRQILDLVLAGHPSKNIAADLGISQRTVDNHRAAIMRKTSCKSLAALIRTTIAAA